MVLVLKDERMNPDQKTVIQMNAELLRSILDYEPATGVFRWKRPVSKWSSVKVGAIAGHQDKSGYCYIKVADVRYSQHRLAWLHVHGEWPTGEVDHIDGNRGNNAISNLRDVTHQVNSQNHRTHYATSTTQRLGVTRHWNKWRAAIRVGGKSTHLGLFDSPDAAHQAFLNAKRQLHEGNTL